MPAKGEQDRPQERVDEREQDDRDHDRAERIDANAGQDATVSSSATVPTTSETIARLISARRPGFHLQSSSTCSR